MSADTLLIEIKALAETLRLLFPGGYGNEAEQGLRLASAVERVAEAMRKDLAAASLPAIGPALPGVSRIGVTSLLDAVHRLSRGLPQQRAPEANRIAQIESRIRRLLLTLDETTDIERTGRARPEAAA